MEEGSNEWLYGFWKRLNPSLVVESRNPCKSIAESLIYLAWISIREHGFEDFWVRILSRNRHGWFGFLQIDRMRSVLALILQGMHFFFPEI